MQYGEGYTVIFYVNFYTQTNMPLALTFTEQQGHLTIQHPFS